MSYQVTFGMMPEGAEIEAPTQESRFRIAVLADFSGRQNRGEIDAIQNKRLIRVNRDNLDEVMAKLSVRLEFPVGDVGPPISLSFNSLDDFHPDQLHDQVTYVADVDEIDQKTGWMNWVLHHPEFQALESTWRGLDWLLARTAKGGKVDVLVLDVSLAELTADLMATEDLSATGLHEILIEKAVRGQSGEPWAAFVGHYTFELSGEHAELLGRIAKIASQANAPFLTTVNPAVCVQGYAIDADAAPAWSELRQLPEAALLSVSVPRFLLRLPYGENTQPINKFSFEEVTIPPDHSHYLWSNPAVGTAALLAQAYLAAGWKCQPGSVRDLDNLPIHTYQRDGEEEFTLADAWLGRPQATQLVKMGIMLYECIRGKGAMRLLRFQSLAQPGLQGHWTTSQLAAAPQVAAAPSASVGMVGSVPDAKVRQQDPSFESTLPPREANSAPTAPTPAPAAYSAPEPEPEPEAEAPAAADVPAEEEMDPDLAALLKQLE